LCADVFREVLVRHELVAGEIVLHEIQEVLTGKFGVPRDVAADVEQMLRQEAIRATGHATIKVRIKDHDDVPILAAALAAKADVFVTGDKELVDLPELAGMPILSPRAFWETLAGRR
jgi:predicted nucleic acid-binding protein